MTKKYVKVYSTSDYKEYPRKETKTMYTTTLRYKVERNSNDTNNPLTPYKQACKKLKTLGQAMEKGKVSHVSGFRFIYSH